MPIYRYEATNSKGRRRRDSLEADTMEGAIAELREMGLKPVVVKELELGSRAHTVPTDEPPFPPRPVGRAWGFRVLFGLPFFLIGVGALVVVLAGGPLFVLIHAVAFGGVGGALTYFGWRSARRWQEVVRHGQATTGAVTATGYDTSMRVNGRPAYRLRYAYEAAGQRYDGSVSTFSRDVERYSDGDALWVLYDPDQPGASAPWPALRPA